MVTQRAMSVEIPDSVKQRAGKCRHDFSCAAIGKCGDKELCKIEYSFGAEVLQLATHDQLDCPYRVSFGCGQLCTCPVRQYLHDTKQDRSA